MSMEKVLEYVDEETDDYEVSSETSEEVKPEPILPKLEPRNACLMQSVKK